MCSSQKRPTQHMQAVNHSCARCRTVPRLTCNTATASEDSLLNHWPAGAVHSLIPRRTWSLPGVQGACWLHSQVRTTSTRSTPHASWQRRAWRMQPTLIFAAATAWHSCISFPPSTHTNPQLPQPVAGSNRRHRTSGLEELCCTGSTHVLVWCATCVLMLYLQQQGT
jgi:hypothetical protein